MRPLITGGVAWSVPLSVCLSVVSPAKLDDLIEMPYGLWTKEQWEFHTPHTKCNFEGEGSSIIRYKE